MNMGSQWFSIIINGYQDISRYIKIYQDISRYIKIYQDISRYIKIYQDISRYIKIYQDSQSFEFLSTWLYHYLTLAMVFLMFSRISPSLASPPFLTVFLASFTEGELLKKFAAAYRMFSDMDEPVSRQDVSLPGRQMAMGVAKAHENRAVKHLEFLKFCWKFWMGN